MDQFRDRRIAFHFDNPTVDGIAFDEDARLWVARFSNGTVDVLDVDRGELLGSYAMGGTDVTNLSWWDTSLYVTVASRHSIERLDLGIRGARDLPRLGRSGGRSPLVRPQITPGADAYWQPCRIPYGDLLKNRHSHPERESPGGGSRLESMSAIPELVPREMKYKGLLRRWACCFGRRPEEVCQVAFLERRLFRVQVAGRTSPLVQ